MQAVARTRDELAEVVARDPLGKVAENPKRYQVTFCSAVPDAQKAERVAELATDAERFELIGREAYAWHPEASPLEALGQAGGRRARGRDHVAQLDDGHEAARAGRRVSTTDVSTWRSGIVQ